MGDLAHAWLLSTSQDYKGWCRYKSMHHRNCVKHMQELAALDDVYGSGAGRSAQGPLLIGSVKSNMGHCEGCSGLAGAPLACRKPSCATHPPGLPMY